MRPRLLAIVAVVAAALSAGCFSVRVAAGPSIDTRSQPGFEGQVLIGIGADVGATVMVAPVMGGGVGNGGEPLLLSGAEVSATQKHSTCVASRFGARFMNRNYFGREENTFLFGGGLLGGVYGILYDELHWFDRTEFRLGAEAHAELLGGDGARGHFALPLVFEFFVGFRSVGTMPCAEQVAAPRKEEH